MLRFPILALLSLAACSPSGGRPAPTQDAEDTASSPVIAGSAKLSDGDGSMKAGYLSYRLRGFQVLLSKQAASHAEEAQAVLTRVDDSLADAVERFGPERAAPLRGVRVWVEWESPNRGTRGPAEFHQSRAWLAEHGYDVERSEASRSTTHASS
jgi:hypothetical protein